MKLRYLLSVLCLMLLPVGVEAQTSADDHGATWLARPSGEALWLFFPPLAQAQYVEGAVRLDCETRLDQRLDCVVASETPAEWGFGSAAVALSRSFRMSPAVREGVPVAGSAIRVPVSFTLPIAEDTSDPAQLDLPLWDSAPSGEAVRTAVPNVRGRAVLSCRVAQDRTLHCVLVRERPMDAGLGEMALRFVPAFRVSERSSAFIAAHRDEPFLLPIDFGFAPEFEPVNTVTTGMTPIQLGAASSEVANDAYPQAARNAGIAGQVTVTCTAGADLLFTCASGDEEPTGWGFAEAALELVRSASPTADERSPFMEGDAVQMTIVFAPPH